LRNAEISKLENTRTKVVASAMPMPLTTVVVTASVAHNPKSSRKTGFS
jgi:hypothetical protein